MGRRVSQLRAIVKQRALALRTGAADEPDPGA
jgi:hypothetical protein